MKCISTLLIVLFTISLFGQEKGITPIIKTDVVNGNTYAVVVGISDYQDEGIPDLNYADDDALAFAGFLQSVAGGSLDEDHLKVLINEEATVAQFAIALDWLWEIVKENDKVIIYFSGHGDVERKSLTQPGFLLCWDAPAKVYMAGGTFALPMLQEVISTLSVQNKAKVIVITDACRSGKLSGNSVGGAQITGANLAKQYSNEIKILSCQPEEYSIEGKQWGGGRGAFSYHLINGLMGLADNNENGQVSLKEIGRYLEDRVTEEVAPLSQNPMIIGNKVEKISDVFPDFLAQVEENKNGQVQFFATASRGIEEDVLAEVDSSVVEIYIAFQKSLKEKNFMSPEDACSEAYYQILSADPKLEKLHSSMRRNYAAALQDDAQQVMNNWLKNDLLEYSLSKVSKAAKYGLYPQYLTRASELLGKDHYMYTNLIARKLYFEGYLMHIDIRNPDEELGQKILAKYRASLQLLPNSPHTFLSMSQVHFDQLDDPDSSEYFTHLAVEYAPTWVEPYSTMSFNYIEHNSIADTDRAKYFLDLADEIDSSAAKSNVFHLNNWGIYYMKTKQFNKSKNIFNKALTIDSTVCATHSNLGNLYIKQKLFPQAEKAYLNAIRLDSTHNIPITNMGITYMYTDKFDKAEEFLLKAMNIDSTNLSTQNALFNLFMKTRRFTEAEEFIAKCIKLDPAVAGLYSNLGNIYMYTNRFPQAEEQLLKCIELDSTFFMAYATLGSMNLMKRDWQQALSWTQKAIKHEPDVANLYGQLGYIYIYLPDHFEEAEIALNKAFKMDPLDPMILLMYSTLYSTHNKLEKAIKYLDQALEIGAGKGRLSYMPLVMNPGLVALHKDPKWNILMKKHFPDKFKD